MNNRITFVSLLNEESLNKIKQLLVHITEPLCKVPYGKGVDDRMRNDTLPYHFTVFSWDIGKEKEVIQFLNHLKFSTFTVLVNQIEIVSGNEGSFDLRFNIKKTKELIKIQKEIYDCYSSNYYIPNFFSFHITIHIDKNYQSVLEIKKRIESEFIPFQLEVDQFGLFEIYPAKLVGRFGVKGE